MVMYMHSMQGCILILFPTSQLGRKWVKVTTPNVNLPTHCMNFNCTTEKTLPASRACSLKMLLSRLNSYPPRASRRVLSTSLTAWLIECETDRLLSRKNVNNRKNTKTGCTRYLWNGMTVWPVYWLLYSTDVPFIWALNICEGSQKVPNWPWEIWAYFDNYHSNMYAKSTLTEYDFENKII